MTLSDRIEANADLTLWAVHTLGMDEVLAAPNHQAADIAAHEFNKAIFAKDNERTRGIMCFSYAAPWPFDAEIHATYLKSWEKNL